MATSNEFLRFSSGTLIAVLGASIVSEAEPLVKVGAFLLIIGVGLAFSTL